MDVRGQHAKEAGLFSLLTATPLTAMQGERAARQILEACRHGRAQVTTGWPAHALTTINALAPETTASLMAASVSWLLPGPSPSPTGGQKRRSRDIESEVLGALQPAAARRHNELGMPAPTALATSSGVARVCRPVVVEAEPRAPAFAAA